MASPVTCCWRSRHSQMGKARFIAIAALGFWMAPATGQPPPASGRAPAIPGRGAASVRWEPWSAMRSAATAIVGWKIGARADTFRPLSFYDAAAKIDQLGVAYVEGASTQKFNEEIPKDVDDHLAPGEINAVKERLNALSLTMTAYRVPAIGPAEDSARKLFEFAHSIGVESIVSEALP